MSAASIRHAEWSRQHDGARAERFARRGLEEDPSCPLARLALARALVPMFRSCEARQLIRQVVAEGRELARAYEELAYLHRYLDNARDDVWALAEAARHAPEDDRLAREILFASHCTAMHDPPEVMARRTLESVWDPVSLKPDPREAAILRDIVVPTYDRLLGKNPSNIHYRYGRARALGQLGDFKDAAAAFRDILMEQRDELRALQGLASALYEAGRHAEALPVYEMLVAVDDKDPEALRLFGEAHAANGSWPDAISAYERALALLPTLEEEAFIRDVYFCATSLDFGFGSISYPYCPGSWWGTTAEAVTDALERARSRTAPCEPAPAGKKIPRVPKAYQRRGPQHLLRDPPTPAIHQPPDHSDLEQRALRLRDSDKPLALERVLERILEVDPERADVRQELAAIQRSHPLPRGGVRRSGGKKLIAINGIACVLHACSSAESYLDRGCPRLRRNANPRFLRRLADEYLQQQVATGRFEFPELLECPYCGSLESVFRPLPNSQKAHTCSQCARSPRSVALQLTPRLERLLGLAGGPGGAGLSVAYLLTPSPDDWMLALISK